MKILKKYSISSLFFIAVLTQVSCKNEFLEIIPKGQTVAINTEDYEKLLNANFIRASFEAGVYRGDEVAGLQPYFGNLSSVVHIRMQRLFRYEDRVYDIDVLPNEVMNSEGYIRRLYLFNTIINEVMDSKGGTEAQKLAILAEAKTGRAISNFMFLSDFTKPYNSATAATDLGIPNLTSADVTQKDFKRETLQQAYDLVIKDLTDALPNLGVVTHRRKVSKLVAEFYLARVYIAMNNFTAAKVHIDAAFLELPKATIPLALYDYSIVLNLNDPTATGTWFPDSGTQLDNEPLVANNSEVAYNIQSGWFQLSALDAFVFSPQTANLYTPTDLRLNGYSPLQTSLINPKPLGMRRRVIGRNGANVGAILPDMYLMRAEIRARANDLAGAVADLELLRVKRITGSDYQVPSGIASNQQALVRFILDERIREFAISGLRWLDMRRLSQDPIYNNHVDYTHEIYNFNGSINATYELKKERFALKFGERMLNESAGLIDNP